MEAEPDGMRNDLAPREADAGQRPSGRFYEPAKRLVDVALSTLALALLSPLLVLVSAAIRLDSPGPVLFRQARAGRYGRMFVMYKFRTMRLGAEQERSAVMELSKHEPPDLKIEDDPRITRVGAFLRIWSVDEIPNLLNVLRGEMSLVGPRPTSWGPEGYEPWQLPRLAVRPGVTGLWQVMGRGDLDFRERVKLDLLYIQKRSLRLDLWILWRTVLAVLSRQGAY
jgi:lipopolysaccharide/colanic/teichoic acid biosynthesis glycosyltransferase